MAADLDLDAFALQVQQAQDSVRPIAPFTRAWPEFSVAQAYGVASRLHAARLAGGARAVGRKIGFTNSDLWDVYGVREPIWGYMYESTVTHLADGSGTCSLARLAEPRIEPEIAFHFRSPPPLGADLATVLDCIDWVAHGFEIVQSHYPGWVFQAPDTIADGSLHGAFLVGPPQPVERLGAALMDRLASLSLTLSRDGKQVDAGRGANALGSPLAAISHLTAVLARQPGAVPVQAGEIVTTGTLTAAHPVHAGERWHTAVQGLALPGLSVQFV